MFQLSHRVIKWHKHDKIVFKNLKYLMFCFIVKRSRITRYRFVSGQESELDFENRFEFNGV